MDQICYVDAFFSSGRTESMSCVGIDVIRSSPPTRRTELKAPDPYACVQFTLNGHRLFTGGPLLMVFLSPLGKSESFSTSGNSSGTRCVSLFLIQM